jgi:hypothetical protein
MGVSKYCTLLQWYPLRACTLLRWYPLRACTLLQWYPLRACTLLQWYPLSVCCCLQKGLGATGLPDSDFCLYQRTFLNNFSTLFHLIHFWRIFFFASFSFLSPTSFLCGKCTRILGVYPSKSAQRRELFK